MESSELSKYIRYMHNSKQDHLSDNQVKERRSQKTIISLVLTVVIQQQRPFYGHYTGQPVLAGTISSQLKDFLGAQFYCLHALADSN